MERINTGTLHPVGAPIGRAATYGQASKVSLDARIEALQDRFARTLTMGQVFGHALGRGAVIGQKASRYLLSIMMAPTPACG